MPYQDARFDRAVLLHVGMNIADKKALFTEIARVTKPGGLLGVYDVMRRGDQKLDYPVAWAREAATSFLGSPSDYRQALQAAGFEIVEEIDKRELALEFFANLRARQAAGGAPPLGLHIVMGKDAPQKMANMFAALQAGAIAPVQMLARRA